MSIRSRYVALAHDAEIRSEWPRLTRGRRLAACAALLAEFALVLGGAAWGFSAANALDAAAWFGLSAAAAVCLSMLVQFAFWPRGAIFRLLVFVVPAVTVLLVPAVVLTILLVGD